MRCADSSRAARVALATAVVLFGLIGPLPTHAQEVTVADTEIERFETLHPYPAGDPGGRIVWSRTLHWSKASFIAVHFDRFELADGDVLQLSDRSGTVVHTYRNRGYRGRGEDFWGLSVQGDTMILRLVSKNDSHAAYGLSIDRWTHGYPLDELGGGGFQAVCGAEDFRDVECYRDSHPEEYAKGRTVMRMLKNGAVHCTGWLVSCENHVLTNQHCVASQSELNSIEFQFDYKLPDCGFGTPSSELQLHGGTLLDVDAALDYALVIPALEGHDPQATYGYLQLDLRIPDDGEQIYIVHHPSGDPRRMSIFSSDAHDESGRCEIYSSTETPCSGSPPQADIGYYCDTEYGSSGAPVLALDSHRVVALHHCADCPNRAVPITEVYAQVQASENPLPVCSICDQGLPATDLSTMADGPNRIQLDWTGAADAVEYRIYRSRMNCEEDMELIGSTTSTSFVDEHASGGITYYYVVRAVNECGAEAADTNCELGGTTGGCRDQPLFAGLESLVNARSDFCTITLGWSEATPQCGDDVRYNVYRSNTPDGDSQLVASCVEGTSWSDSGVLHAETYFYVVRAEDNSGDGDGPCAAGNEDENSVTVWGYSTGPLRAYAAHDFEAVGDWALEGEWEIGSPAGLGGTAGSGQGEPDPPAAFAGDGVLGFDLSGQGFYPGNYESSTNPTQYATSPPFSAADEVETVIRFKRWLGVEKLRYDRASLDVFDGSTWHNVWENPDAAIRDDSWLGIDVDVSMHLAGVADAQVRFGIESDGSVNYCGWNIDELEIVGGGACTTADAGLAPVPDGALEGGSPMTASPAATAGDVVLTWDAGSCPAPDVHLLFGESDTLAGYVFAGGRCSLGTSGSAVVAIPDPQPGQFTWWTLAAADGGTESHHGHDSTGAVRPADGTGFCGISDHDTTGRCP